MKIAVVGAGFAGLAAAYFLSKHHVVTLLDSKGIGGGASGVSAGLLHPYPGEKGRKSWHADEAMADAKELIEVAETALGKPVAQREGILKIGLCQNPGSDVECLGEDRYLITSGITVDSTRYLQGLWRACEKQGVQLLLQSTELLDELRAFDRVVLAVGAGIRHFPECRHLNLGYVKGQVLTCRLKTPLQRSISAKRYTAVIDEKTCHIGSTYEREFVDDVPCQETAIRLLQPEEEVLECKAAIRVTNRAHYFPLVEQINATTWVITAMGSRGLLYHGYCGKIVDHRISWE